MSSNNQIRNRTLKELTIKDNFMFAAVMLNPDNCSRLVEMIFISFRDKKASGGSQPC